MAYIPVNKKTGTAIARELQDVIEVSDSCSDMFPKDKYELFHGYINLRLKSIISQLKEGGILIADKK